MPYQGEKASGEALISFFKSKIFEDFQGKVRSFEPEKIPQITPAHMPQASNQIKRIIAFDGSIVTQTVENGYPGADASLLQIALVAINLNELLKTDPNQIISPKVFNEMDEARTLQTVLPGRNVIEFEEEPPKDFFRRKVYEALHGKVVQSGHETLLDTFKDLVKERSSTFKCPHHDECGKDIEHDALRRGKNICQCPEEKPIYATDQLRFHERFNETGSNGEPHGEVRHFLEIILLLNVLRYFLTSDELIRILPEIAFVLDGPLAVFGQFASISPLVKNELKRINQVCFEKTEKDILLFSLIKSGAFVEHFDHLDFDDENGPGKKYSEGTVLLPDIKYIHQAIVRRPLEAKEWGKDTYFGRMVLYKNSSGQRMVINTPIISDEADDLSNTSLKAYPRLNEITPIIDKLSTYLFEGGFVPIVRAHSHAAIPLHIGGEILKDLFRDDA